MKYLLRFKKILRILREIDEHYKDYCNQCDEGWGDEIGTGYENDIKMEYYIESSWWHQVSLLIRK